MMKPSKIKQKNEIAEVIASFTRMFRAVGISAPSLFCRLYGGFQATIDFNADI
ncbi:MAG: hypothetical protein ABL859_12185 [Methylotenera sp.]